MANDKRCDICGKYFAIPEPGLARLYNSEAGAVQLFKLGDRLHRGYAAYRSGRLHTG